MMINIDPWHNNYYSKPFEYGISNYLTERFKKSGYTLKLIKEDQIFSKLLYNRAFIVEDRYFSEYLLKNGLKKLKIFCGFDLAGVPHIGNLIPIILGYRFCQNDSNLIFSFNDLEAIAVRRTPQSTLEISYSIFQKIKEGFSKKYNKCCVNLRLRSEQSDLLPIMALLFKNLDKRYIQNIYQKVLKMSEIFSLIVMCAEVIWIIKKFGVPILLIYGLEEYSHIIFIFNELKKIKFSNFAAILLWPIPALNNKMKMSKSLQPDLNICLNEPIKRISQKVSSYTPPIIRQDCLIYCFMSIMDKKFSCRKNCNECKKQFVKHLAQYLILT